MRRAVRWTRRLGPWVTAFLVGCQPRPVAPPVEVPPPAPVEPVWDPAARLGLATPRDSAYSTPTAPAGPPLEAKAAACAVQADLSNLTHREPTAGWSANRRKALATQGFCAVPLAPDDPAAGRLYAANAAQGVPSFLTADLAWAAFARVVQRVAADLPGQVPPAALRELVRGLLERSQAQSGVLASPELKEAARLNAATLGVAARLLGLGARLDPAVERLVQAELRQCADRTRHRGELFPYALDYDRLPAQFTGEAAAVAWLSLAAYLPRSSTPTGESTAHPVILRRLLLLAHALATPPDTTLRAWQAVEDTHAFLAGGGAGPGLRAVIAAAAAIHGEPQAPRDYDDPGKLAAFGEALGRACAGGLALVGAGAALEDDLAARLGPSAPGGRVTGLALFAALGQPRAEALVRDHYRLPAKHPAFGDALRGAREAVAKASAEQWRRDLPRGRLWALAGLAPVAGQTPAFQRAPAWADKVLLTTLTAWTLGRAAPPASWEEPPPAEAPTGEPPPAWVEPVPAFYHRLAWLTEALSAGLREHKLADRLEVSLDALIAACRGLERIASTEVRGESPSPADRGQLRDIARQLEDLASQAATDASCALDASQRASLGPPLALWVVVPWQGEPCLARGVLWGYAEHPAEAARPSGHPDWTTSFLDPRENRPG